MGKQLELLVFDAGFCGQVIQNYYKRNVKTQNQTMNLIRPHSPDLMSDAEFIFSNQTENKPALLQNCSGAIW